MHAHRLKYRHSPRISNVASNSSSPLLRAHQSLPPSWRSEIKSLTLPCHGSEERISRESCRSPRVRGGLARGAPPAAGVERFPMVTDLSQADWVGTVTAQDQEVTERYLLGGG